jgi:hypothetical protein
MPLSECEIAVVGVGNVSFSYANHVSDPDLYAGFCFHMPALCLRLACGFEKKTKRPYIVLFCTKKACRGRLTPRGMQKGSHPSKNKRLTSGKKKRDNGFFFVFD